MTKKETDTLINDKMDTEKQRNINLYLFPKRSQDWDIGGIVTVKLDCNAWTVSYKHEAADWWTKDIARDKRYNFVMRMCAQERNEFECVETPPHHYKNEKTEEEIDSQIVVKEDKTETENGVL